MPFVEVFDFLVLDVVIDFQTLQTVFLHEILDDRGHYFLVNLMHSERRACGIPVFGCPQTRYEVELYP